MSEFDGLEKQVCHLDAKAPNYEDRLVRKWHPVLKDVPHSEQIEVARTLEGVARAINDTTEMSDTARAVILRSSQTMLKLFAQKGGSWRSFRSEGSTVRVIVERNEEGSRELIMLRLLELKTRGEDWVEARRVLVPCTEKGPWSEDLQNLVREGAVECQGPVDEMGMNSPVRLAP